MVQCMFHTLVCHLHATNYGRNNRVLASSSHWSCPWLSIERAGKFYPTDCFSRPSHRSFLSKHATHSMGRCSGFLGYAAM